MEEANSLVGEASIPISYHALFPEESKTKWTEAMVAKLIDMYKDRRVLYDSQMSSNHEQRSAHIRDIAAELGISGLFMFVCLSVCPFVSTPLMNN